MLPRWNLKLAYLHKGKERLKKKADHSRLVGGRFIKQGNLHFSLVLCSPKIKGNLHPPVEILRVHVQTLTKFSNILSPDGLNSTVLSQEYVLEIAPRMGLAGGMFIPKLGEVVRCLWLPGSSSKVNHWSCPLDDLLQQRSILRVYQFGKYYYTITILGVLFRNIH